MPEGVPEHLAQRIKATIFEVPDTAGLTEAQKILVHDLYVRASMSVFYLWLGAMAVCLGLMVFIKDKGLVRNEEEPKAQEGSSGSAKSIQIGEKGEKKVEETVSV